MRKPHPGVHVAGPGHQPHTLDYRYASITLDGVRMTGVSRFTTDARSPARSTIALVVPLPGRTGTRERSADGHLVWAYAGIVQVVRRAYGRTDG